MATTHRSGQQRWHRTRLDAGDADARTCSYLCLLVGNHARCAQLHLGNHSRRGNSARTGLSLFFRGFSTCFSLQNLHNFHRLPVQVTRSYQQNRVGRNTAQPESSRSKSAEKSSSRKPKICFFFSTLARTLSCCCNLLVAAA